MCLLDVFRVPTGSLTNILLDSWFHLRFFQRTHPSCVLHASLLMVRWPSARGRANCHGFLSRNFSCSTAYFSVTDNVWNWVDFSLHMFLLSGAATLLTFGTNRQNALHSPKKGWIFVWLVGSFKFSMVWVALFETSNRPEQIKCLR